jgi:predicted phosphodiesterase
MASMLVCAAGDIHGALDRFYADVAAFEASLEDCFDWILHVGDFGVWPDRARVDGATRRHDGAGDFPAWWADRRPAPRRTVFVKGNHEDFVWLDAQASPEILPGLCLFGHHHARFDADVDGISCLGLNKVGMPGNLVAIKFEERGRGWAIAGEWPPRRPA